MDENRLNPDERAALELARDYADSARNYAHVARLAREEGFMEAARDLDDQAGELRATVNRLIAKHAFDAANVNPGGDVNESAAYQQAASYLFSLDEDVFTGAEWAQRRGVEQSRRHHR